MWWHDVARRWGHCWHMTRKMLDLRFQIPHYFICWSLIQEVNLHYFWFCLVFVLLSSSVRLVHSTKKIQFETVNKHQTQLKTRSSNKTQDLYQLLTKVWYHIKQRTTRIIYVLQVALLVGDFRLLDTPSKGRLLIDLDIFANYMMHN